MKKSFKTCASVLNLLAMLTGVNLRAQDSIENQPAPKAVPVEDLGPQFDNNGTVTSYSEQFRITGGDAATRGLAANLAEEAKEELLRLSEEKDDWKVPVKINLVGQEGGELPKREAVIKLNFNDERYEVLVFVSLSRGLRPLPLKRSVTEALVYAHGLRDKPFEEDMRFLVPPWFVEGLREATAWRLKQTDRRLYDALFQHGGLFKLSDLFAMGDAEFGSIDAASKVAFKVSAGALVMALLEQPEGKVGIRGFMAELPAYDGEMPELLRRHFPDLNLSQTSLAKWWALQLANKGSAPLTEAMSVVATELALEEALRLRYRDAEGILQEIPLADWSQIVGLEEEERVDSVRLAQDDLLRLSYRCFPSYRSLLLEYQALLADLGKGETEDFEKSFGALSETRQTMVAKAERARDFLDWFEITRARETSGVFDDYLDLKARLKSQTNLRQDDMSKYLDRLDPLFHLPEETRSSFPNNDLFSPY